MARKLPVPAPKPEPGVLKRKPRVGGASKTSARVAKVQAQGLKAARAAEQGVSVTRPVGRAEGLAKQFSARLQAKATSVGQRVATKITGIAKHPRQALTAAKNIVKAGDVAGRARQAATAGRIAKVGIAAKGLLRGTVGRAALAYGYLKIGEAAIPQILSAGAKIKRTSTLLGQAKAGRLKEKALQVGRVQVHSVHAAKVAKERYLAKQKK